MCPILGTITKYYVAGCIEAKNRRAVRVSVGAVYWQEVL